MSEVGVPAPCELGKSTGTVFDWDSDNKEGLCVCEVGVCAVDARNLVIASCKQGDPKSPYAKFAVDSSCIVHQADIRAISLML